MGWGPKAPNMKDANKAALMEAQLAQEQWETFKRDYAPVLFEQMEADRARSDMLADAAMEQQRVDLERAQRYDDRYWGVQVPLEDRLISEAYQFNEGAERDRLAGAARADVEQAFTNSVGQAARGLGRHGVNPNSGRFAGAIAGMETSRAAAEADAMNRTRQAARELGWAKLVDVTALGRGLPGFTGSATQLAQGWGSQGANNLGMNSAGAAVGAMNQTANVAGGLYGNAASNLRQNAVESAKNPTFELGAGLITGGLQAWGASRRPSSIRTGSEGDWWM